MERLTERDEFGNADLIGVDSEDLQINLTFDELNKVTNALNKLAEYEDMEEQGKLLKLPCSVGDTVYVVYSPNSLVLPYTYKAVKMENLSKIVDYMKNDKFGKTVFLTQAEAKAALKEFPG